VTELTDGTREPAPANTAALMWFGVCTLAVTLILIFLLRTQTTWVDGQPLSRQPALSSIVSLFGMALFGTGWLINYWRHYPDWWRTSPLSEFRVWLAGLEYVGWFMIYVYLVPISGYLLTTLAFCILLTLRCGYRSRRAIISAALTGLFIVLLFKTFLAVKIPAAKAYEYLPDALRNFMIIYF
jgi:hypothetical protein